MKKFEKTDKFINVVKAHPKVTFFTYNGKIYVNNTKVDYEKINEFLTLRGYGQVLDKLILTEDGFYSLITEDGDYIVIEY